LVKVPSTTQSKTMPDLPQTPDDLTLLIVVLNYRTPALTIECLRSLVEEIPTLPPTRVVVTDNNSGDGSVEQIQAAIGEGGWEAWASLMPLPENGGFAYGNNAAIRPSYENGTLPPYVMLLNPDTVVRPGAIRTLWQFLEANPKVGMAGSRLEDPDGTPQCSAFRFHSLWSEIDAGMRLGLITRLLNPWVVAPPVPTEACQTDWVAGASLMMRREVIQAIGLMDEGYFMYYEEMDYCLQAKRAGWPCWYVPDSRIIHYVGQASGVTDTKRPPKRRPQYWFDSRRRYFIKNYGWLYGAMADTLWAAGFTTWRVRRVFQQKPDTDPPQMLEDFLRNSVFIRGRTIGPAKTS